MAVTLGADPQELTVILVRGSDFRCVLEATDVAWPNTATVYLVMKTRDPIADVRWDAARSGTDMTFNEDTVDVDAVIAANPREASLWHEDGTLKVLWAKGLVKVSG